VGRCLANLRNVRSDNFACFGGQEREFSGRTLRGTEPGTGLHGRRSGMFGRQRARTHELLAPDPGGPGGRQQGRKILQELVTVARG
jgi:hypothetical protein